MNQKADFGENRANKVKFCLFSAIAPNEYMDTDSVTDTFLALVNFFINQDIDRLYGGLAIT